MLNFTACSCNVFGSEREDCEQTTGQCVCKHHVTGRKCDMCANGRHIEPHGCTGMCNAVSLLLFAIDYKYHYDSLRAESTLLPAIIR